MTESDFLTLIVENRNDMALRLAYADWLDGRGERDRARYLRADVLLAQMVERRVSPDKLPLLELTELQGRIDRGWLSSVDFLYDVVLEECPLACTSGVTLYLMQHWEMLTDEALAAVTSPPAVVVSALGWERADGLRGSLQRDHDEKFRNFRARPLFGIRLKSRKD